MNAQLIELPAALIAQAKARTGKRTARAAVMALLEEQLGEPEALTPEQCAQRMAKDWDKVVITPEMRALGVTQEFFKP